MSIKTAARRIGRAIGWTYDHENEVEHRIEGAILIKNPERQPVEVQNLMGYGNTDIFEGISQWMGISVPSAVNSHRFFVIGETPYSRFDENDREVYNKFKDGERVRIHVDIVYRVYKDYKDNDFTRKVEVKREYACSDLKRIEHLV